MNENLIVFDTLAPLDVAFPYSTNRQASGSGSATTAQAAPVNPNPRNMGSAPSRPISMGSGSLGMGAMSNSLMPGGMPVSFGGLYSKYY